jgi:pimeloyl-ACP methyl ester carboxylesterase
VSNYQGVDVNAQDIRSGFADLNGAQFYYEVAGAGHPLILLHEGIADSRMWDDQFHVFAKKYTVVRYDARGYGQTKMVAGPFSRHGDLLGLMDYLGIERAYLLGCSMGGATIIDFALEHPERVAALIPGCSGLGGYQFTGEEPPQWTELEAAYKAKDFERAAELEVQIWVDGPHRTPDQVDARIRDRVRDMNTIALATPDDLGIEQKLDPPAIGRLSEIRAPTLVIYGDLDDPNIPAIADLLAKGIPGAKKVVIPGTAHVPNMERPDEFNSLVLNFLNPLG